MSLWEYKHITSGPHGFATPALLESYLNQLGKDEWEIISYQTLPTNSLAFNGVARRTTLRDWTLETAAAAAAKIEADKIRAEFAAKFQGNAPAGATGDAAAEKPASLVADTAAPEDGFRKLRDTDRDGDPDAHEGEDWDEWDNYDDDLPTFFEAIKPHLRKNQRGPGQSVGVMFLAKRWEQAEADLIGALKECGFVIPEREDDAPVHLEFEGELYWLNLNNRHELFLNTREKPRPVFRAVAAKPLDPSDPAAVLLAEEAAVEQAEKAKREAERLAREAEQAARRAEHEARRVASQAAAQAAREAAQAAREAAQASAASGAPAPSGEGNQAASMADGEASAAPASSEGQAARPEIADGPLPQGEDLLAAIRPQMRRNRRGPGYSGSTVYLARAFKHSEADLVTALAAVGLHVPETANEKPVKTTIGGYVYWLNKDGRGGIWINGDEARGAKPEAVERKPEPVVTEQPPATAAESLPAAEAVAEPAPVAVEPAPAAPTPVLESGDSDSPLAAVRPLLKPNKRGSGVSAEVGVLARSFEVDLQVFLATLGNLGLALPAAEGDKPAFVEHADEIYWFNKNPKDGSVWLNAKTSRAGAKKAAGAPKAKAKKPAKAE
ncbi:MAG: hypothetical protein WC205_16355 [Opitutaceae bacterium]|jgi:hypothetical protein